MSLIRENRDSNDPRKQVQINVPPPPPPTVPTGLEADPSLASQIPPEPSIQDIMTPAEPTLQDKVAGMAQGSSPEMLSGFQEPPDINSLDPSAIPESIDLTTTPGQTDYSQPDFSGAPTTGQVEQLAQSRAAANIQAMQTAAYVNPASAYIEGGMPRLFEGATSADLFEWQQKFSQFTARSDDEARRNLVNENFQPQQSRHDPNKPNFNSLRNPLTSGGVPGMINSLLRRAGSMFEPSEEFNPFAGYQTWWNDVQKNPWKIVTAPFVPLIASTQGKYGEFGNGWWGSAIYTLSLPENIVKGGLTDLTNLISGNTNPESGLPNIVQAVLGQNYDFSQDSSPDRPLGTIGGETVPKTREELRQRSWLYRVPLSGLLEKTPLGVITGGDRLSNENISKLPETVNVPLLGERPTVNIFRTSEFLGGLVLDAISGATDNVVRAAGNRFWNFLNPNASPTAPKPGHTGGVHHSTSEVATEAIEKFFPANQQAVRHNIFHPEKPVYGEIVTSPELSGVKPKPGLPPVPEVVQGELVTPRELPPGLRGGELSTIPSQGEFVTVPVGKPVVERGSFPATDVIIDAETVRPLLPEASSQVIPSEVLSPPKAPSQIMTELQQMTPGQRVNPSALVHVPRSNEELTALARFRGDVPPTRMTPLSELRIEHLGQQYPPGLNPYARYGQPIPIEKLDAPNPVVQVGDDVVANVWKDPLVRGERPLAEVLTEFLEGSGKNRFDSEFTDSVFERFKIEGDAEKALMRIYQSGEFYKPINVYLREGREGLVKYAQQVVEEIAKYDEVTNFASELARAERAVKLIPYLDELFKKQPLMTGYYYRGLGGNAGNVDIDSVLKRYVPGTFVEESAFTAVSRDINVADIFAGKPGNRVMFEIKGSAYSLPGLLTESVFPPSSRFRVDEVINKDGIVNIKMTQVSPENIDLGLDNAMKVLNVSNPEDFARVVAELPEELKTVDPRLLQEWLDGENVARNLEINAQELATEVVEVKRALAQSLERMENTPNVGRRNALDAAQFEPSKPPEPQRLSREKINDVEFLELKNKIQEDVLNDIEGDVLTAGMWRVDDEVFRQAVMPGEIKDFGTEQKGILGLFNYYNFPESPRYPDFDKFIEQVWTRVEPRLTPEQIKVMERTIPADRLQALRYGKESLGQNAGVRSAAELAEMRVSMQEHYNYRTVAQLKRIAEERGVNVPSRARKEAIVNLLIDDDLKKQGINVETPQTVTKHKFDLCKLITGVGEAGSTQMGVQEFLRTCSQMLADRIKKRWGTNLFDEREALNKKINEMFEAGEDIPDAIWKRQEDIDKAIDSAPDFGRRSAFNQARKEYGDAGAVINDYTRSGYESINSALRGKKPSIDALEDAGILINSLDELPPYTGRTVRFTQKLPVPEGDIKPGYIYKDPGFASATRADAPTSFDGKYRLEFESKTGRDISPFSHYSFNNKETEVLFKPNTPFEVTSVVKEGNTTVIRGKEILSGTDELISPTKPFYHGSKVRELDLNSIDPLVGSARHELGTGIYLTDNIKYAEDYARAVPHRNLPPIEGRSFDEVGQVFEVNPNIRKTINAGELAPQDVHDAFLKTVAESFDEEVNRAVRKVLGVKKPLKNFREYYTTVDGIVSKVAGGMDFPESEVLQFQRIVGDKLRVLGYDSILDTSTTDNVLVLLNPGTANAQPIKQIGSGSLIEQAAARYNAASTTAARYGGKNKVLNTISEEANVSLQTQLAQQTLENFDNVSKRAEDATRNLIEQERLLKRQARSEAPKRKAQAQRKYDAQNQNQIRHDSAIDKNPCI